MSAIASFRLVRNEDIERLKNLAPQPVGPGAGGKWHDPYWEFLFANAQELGHFDWSGYVMLDVSLILDSCSAKLDEHCDKPLSDYFCKARESSISVFQAGPGKRLAHLIEANAPDKKTIEAFLASPDMVSPLGDGSPPEAVVDGLRVLKSWLSQINEDHVGLLSLG